MIGLGSDKKKKLGPLDKKIEMICLAIGQYQPGIFYLQNYEFQRNTHFFTLGPLGQHWDFKQFFFLDLNVSTDIPTAKRVIRKPNIFCFCY